MFCFIFFCLLCIANFEGRNINGGFVAVVDCEPCGRCASGIAGYDEPQATIVPTLSLRTSYSDDEIDGQRDDDDDDGDNILVSTLRSPLVDGEDSTLDNENLARTTPLWKRLPPDAVLSRYFSAVEIQPRERTVSLDTSSRRYFGKGAGVS